MDFHYDIEAKSIYYNTFENRNGDRAIKFFEHHQIKQGFVISDVSIAKDLCWDIHTKNRLFLKDANYDFVFDYIAKNNKLIWYWISIPVISFIDYAKQSKNYKILHVLL